MKRKGPSISRIVSVVIGAGLLLACAAPADEWHSHAPCSVSTLEGTFGFYRTGTIEFGAGGLAALGILAFDGRGNASGHQSISRNGDYTYDLDGEITYQVAPDCTGKGFLEGEEFFRFIITDEGHGIYMFSESEGNAVYGVGRKIRD